MVRWWPRSTEDNIPWSEKRFWVLDLELSSLDPREGHILSAGWVTIEQGVIQLSQAGYTLFRQSAQMGDDVMDTAHLHHITDQQRQGGADLGDWLEDVLAEQGNAIWVMHHAPLDMGFMKENARRFGIDWAAPTALDTLKFEKKQLSRQFPASYRDLNLNACRRRYGLPPYRAHHALSDALATAELCLAQIRSRLDASTTLRDLRRAYR